MRTFVAVAALLVAVAGVASATAPPANHECCLPAKWALNNSRVTTLPHNSAFPGDVEGFFAVDTTKNMAYFTGHNWTSQASQTWFVGTKGYTVLPGVAKCFQFPVASSPTSAAQYCVGASAPKFSSYVRTLTVGLKTQVDVWADEAAGDYTLIQRLDANGNADTCVPVGEVGTFGQSFDFGFSTDFDESVFTLPASCNTGSAVIVSTTQRRLKEEHSHDVDAILASIPLH